jgi:acetyl-CoA carboxylase biotin carboxyl carrier protein
VDLKQIKELMSAMGRSDIGKLKIKDGEFEIQLDRTNDDQFERVENSASQPSHHRGNASHAHISTLPASESAMQTGELKRETGKAAELNHKEVESKFITSPMVGTFYHSPSPEDPSFVKIGDRVEEHTVVCIIEAMKVMNEVKAGVKGVVAELLVENSHPVEFGTNIFRIE